MTIIDCEGSPGSQRRGFQIASGPPTLVIEGLTIRNGYHVDGGGVMIRWGTTRATIVDSTIRGNTAVGNGGGVAIGWTSGDPNGPVTMTGCTLTANSVLQSGGGAMVRDGGLALTVGGKAFVERSASEFNAVQLDGAGIHAFGFFPGIVDVVVRDSTIRSNFAGETSGAIRTSGFGHGPAIELELANTLVSGNFAPSFAVGNISTAAWTVTNATIANNSSFDGIGIRLIDSAFEGRNLIMWSNGTSAFPSTGSTADITHSNIQGGFPGVGNIDAPPLFVDAGAGDFRLAAGSPCIDAGDSAAVPAWMTLDLDGNPRIVDGLGNGLAVVDMGAFESPTPPCAFADLHCDGIVDRADLGLLLAAWGTCDACPEDLNGDGIVDGADPGILVSVWTTP